MINVAVLGASGYGGSEVLRILARHPHVKINYIGAKANANATLSSIFPYFEGIFDGILQDKDMLEVARNNDCIIAATPHNFLAHSLSSEVIEECVLIDLSADFRLKNRADYEEYYGFKHTNALLENSVYGLCELYRDDIKNANLIANPGCYPTASTFCIAPMLHYGIIDTKSIIIDAKSGISGAGRSSNVANLFCEVAENIRPYGLIKHRHVAEIEQNLGNIAKESIQVTFTPHVVPMSRGILAVAYASVKESVTQKDIDRFYKEFYKDSFFVHLLENGKPLETKWVSGSNFVKVSAKLDERNNRVIMMCVIDNLIKGAAGASVQNLNIRFGLDEKIGLDSIGIFP